MLEYLLELCQIVFFWHVKLSIVDLEVGWNEDTLVFQCLYFSAHRYLRFQKLQCVLRPVNEACPSTVTNIRSHRCQNLWKWFNLFFEFSWITDVISRFMFDLQDLKDELDEGVKADALFGELD